jgi:hypothetical protein
VSDSEAFFGGMVVAVVIGVLVWVITGTEVDKKWQAETVKRGFAEYNQTNGNWQWKESK